MSRTRGTWNTKGAWAAGVTAAAVAMLTGYALFSGDDGGAETPAKGGPSASAPSSASPAPSYSVPDDWTEPERWAALPRGKRTDDRGSEVGFPHTAEGAAAMLAAANSTTMENGRTTVDEQLRIYYSYIGKVDHSTENAEKVELAAMQADKSLAKAMGVTPGHPLPAGAYQRNHVVGYKILRKTPDEVTMWVLSRVTQKAGELEKEKGSYTRTVMGVQWREGDWKITSAATQRALQDAQSQTKPEMVAPGDAEFNRSGWTAIREAS
ncbi:hypothetical protein [Streptomyces lateritius]|uniref:hypothetical protein n=1 Tax=Streptomyces lateritius TaxID=67313 RepID=UPI001678549C|nr:hypothetical protein [Streptomyces lateritius]GGU12713.1 hypothetical protein GCM10010272_67380 [Streptomyces lateritius]